MGLFIWLQQKLYPDRPPPVVPPHEYGECKKPELPWGKTRWTCPTCGCSWRWVQYEVSSEPIHRTVLRQWPEVGVEDIEVGRKPIYHSGWFRDP